MRDDFCKKVEKTILLFLDVLKSVISLPHNKSTKITAREMAERKSCSAAIETLKHTKREFDIE